MAPTTNGSSNGTSPAKPPKPSTHSPSLLTDYPWTASPLLISAPMGGFATAPLATSVSLSGGIGLIGAVLDMAALETELQIARRTFIDAGLMRDESASMPLGVGFLPFILEMREAVEVVRRFRPRVVWLSFAREVGDYKVWAEAMRGVSPRTKIWVMLGTVAAALEVVESARPDVLVMQGADAGGHGVAKGASVVSVVPETIDALEAAGWGHVPVVAAGGIVDGRGLAAASALGAKGVVMGTRFLASYECVVPHPMYREFVLKARDGGEATVRARVFDELWGENIWPEAYDGRAIRNLSWQDEADGAGTKEIQERYAEAAKGEDGGYASNGDGAKGRTMIWAGAGVGLVNKMQRAGDILDEVRKGAKKALEAARSNL